MINVGWNCGTRHTFIMPEDQALLRRFSTTGDPEAFRAIAERYAPAVHSACLRILDDKDLAEDAAQAVFLLFIRKSKTLDAGHLYLEKDVNGWIGLSVIVVSIVGSAIAWAYNVYVAVSILGAAALLDLVVWLVAGPLTKTRKVRRIKKGRPR